MLVGSFTALNTAFRLMDRCRVTRLLAEATMLSTPSSVRARCLCRP
ncbi:BnaC05g50620D [Brassica napus]|uniref:BnaC05g50620D protein n=1 Tax=Brassica napus TaxID=3708 RepID=A0A078IAN3_BRANA|nr:BnaC05g50620D [Brassica napus]